MTWCPLPSPSAPEKLFSPTTLGPFGTQINPSQKSRWDKKPFCSSLSIVLSNPVTAGILVSSQWSPISLLDFSHPHFPSFSSLSVSSLCSAFPPHGLPFFCSSCFPSSFPPSPALYPFSLPLLLKRDFCPFLCPCGTQLWPGKMRSPGPTVLMGQAPAQHSDFHSTGALGEPVFHSLLW